MKKLSTAESVTEGHPDKIADQLSDAVLDAYLRQDPESRVACEVLVTNNTVVVSGEVTSQANVDVEQEVRIVVHEICRGTAQFGPDENCQVEVRLQAQALGVAANALEGNAADQGVVTGFACTQTPAFMPASAFLAHALTARIDAVRHAGGLPFVRPDGKAQVTVAEDQDGTWSIDSIILSTQHDESVSLQDLRDAVLSSVIERAIPTHLLSSASIMVNPQAGRFEVGGSRGDTGLTGRKIVVDAYGPDVPVGGGAFSGKDPTKVDRSGAYMARLAAKSVVRAGLASKCLIKVSYCIGRKLPIAVDVEAFGTETAPVQYIADWVQKRFSFCPGDIISYLRLRRPIYRQTAVYGHFGRELPSFTWEG